MKNKKIGLAVAGVVLVGASFGGGYAFATSQTPTGPSFTMGANMPGGQFMRTGGTGNRMMGGFISGEILSKDANTITVKTQDGSTKIVLVGGSAQILKSEITTTSDLVVGENVTVTGSTNSDGSLTAQSIQLRPAGVGPMGTATSSRP